jgi:hypothetical protein
MSKDVEIIDGELYGLKPDYSRMYGKDVIDPKIEPTEENLKLIRKRQEDSKSFAEEYIKPRKKFVPFKQPNWFGLKRRLK